MTTGDVGYRYLLRALADSGHSDVIYEMNNQSDKPGYGYQLKMGATSLTEKWDAGVGSFGSQNHFMLGQINEWFFHDLAGIQSDPKGPGFQKIIIKPAEPGDLEWVKATYNSVRGPIAVEWRREKDRFLLNVTVPPNTIATIYLPAKSPEEVTESGVPLAKVSDVKFAGLKDLAVALEIGGGNYKFAVFPAPKGETGP